MSATAAVNPASPPAPAARPAANPSSPADEGRFDRHLDAARQQHDHAGDSPASDDGQQKPAAKTPAPDAQEHKAAVETVAKPVDDSADVAALAAAMLALIGQAAPAKPAALAPQLTQAAPKTVAGAQAAHAPAALVLLAGAATAAAVKPATGLDTGALAPMLAKPAEQKDAPLDASRIAGLVTPSVAPSASPTVAPTHALNIASSAGTPAFAQELGQHIVWLGAQEVKQARIRLHPEDLGTLDVKVSMNHDRVDVSFAVQHPAAVHAVQQTLPQLDALLAHHGLALGQADVGQRQHQGEGGRGGEAPGAIGEVDADPAAMASASVAALGMLDTFA